MTSSRPPVFLLACTVTASCFVACVGDDPTSSTTTPDASTSDVAPPDGGGGGDTGAPITDAGDAGPRCNPSAPFGPPEPIVELNEVASATVYPRPTIRGMYFGSDRHAPATAGNDLSHIDLWFAPWSGAGLGQASRLLEASTAGQDSSPTESADGLSLYFDGVVSADGGEARRLHRATRQDPNGKLGSATPLMPFVDSVNDLTPYLVGSTLYFASQRADAGGYRQLYRVAVDDGGLAGEPTVVPGIEPSWDVVFPVVSPDEKTLYFGRIVTGSKVYVATRGGTSVPFGKATELTQVNTKTYAAPSFVSADGCELTMHLREEGERFAAYRARRPM